jgi:hypothetical protein
MKITAKLATLAAGSLLVAAPAVLGYGGSYDGGDRDRDDRPERAVSYINPDTGAATENADVDPRSSCFSPDRYDTQRLSDPGTANRNVHNDACFFGDDDRDRYGDDDRDRYGDDDRDARKIDAPATYVSSGVGVISACPDPDGAGPKFAILRDRNGDGRNDFCFQSGYQEKGIAGDEEFHARLNNTTTAGSQYVTWCYDSDRNGCSDENVKDRIQINWVR